MRAWALVICSVRCGICVQERLGLELACLAEDPAGATVAAVVREAQARLTSQPIRTQPAAAAAHCLPAGASILQPRCWIAPAPAGVKLRLFCLPYAGGVSENVFARYAQTPPLLQGWVHGMVPRSPHMQIAIFEEQELHVRSPSYIVA